MTEESLFQRAVEIDPPEERTKYVEQACGDQQELCDNVLALLAAHDSEDLLLDRPDGLVETDLLPNDTTADQIGRQIGPYKLLQQIGQGGFGVVYLAEESRTINRRVALKLIKPGMGSKEVIARFQAERQALAMMEHDNIARVFGGGTTDEGLPYFVMELVKGIPITEFCDQKRLSTSERLALFITICRGVQHAHQKGIIHRDLKPSNILVAEYDHRPVVKIIDFGVAKALNQRLTEQTLFTAYGSVVGTMQYMSPEQAKFNQLDVDTRSDVYSLGAVLYELLTGSTPIAKERVQSASLEEVIRWIREEEPSKPSTKVGSKSKSDGSPATDEIETDRLSRLIRGDLDWIVMKTLEKDRDRRYESASELADDIQRFLDQEPVLASPPSLMYKTRKFVQRNRSAVVGTGLIAALALVAVGSLVQMRINQVERDRIQAQKELQDILFAQTLREQEQQDRRQAEEKELRESTIPAIRSSIAGGDHIAAFELASEAIKQFPDNAQIQQFMTTVSSRWVVITNPPDAEVRLWPYEDSGDAPIVTGTTPLSLDLGKGVYRYQIAKEGYESIEGCAGPEVVSLDRTLDPIGNVPDGMVRVPASASVGIASDFFIDRFEVTNRQFKDFLDKGGYEGRSYWKNAPGYGNNWQAKVSELVDQTGKHGPRFWRNDTYLPDTEDLPVVGIAWAEAMAYAKFKGMTLPSIDHWNLACGHEFESATIPASNLESEKLLPVGQCKGLGPYGTVDMIGNAAEWCFNAYGASARTIGGSSFLGPSYNTRAGTPLPHASRESFLGFRCMKSIGSEDSSLFIGLADDNGEVFDGRKPVRDRDFQVIRRTYAYDKTKPLNVKPEGTVESFYPGVTRDAYSFDTAYEGRMLAYVFRPSGPIPTNAQIMVGYFGGDGYRLDEFGTSNASHIRGMVGTGRILVAPILCGMHERRHEIYTSLSERLRKQVQDVSRCVDFLRKSPDFAGGRLIFLGRSHGAKRGPIVCALDSRFAAAVYFSGGISPDAMEPERDTVNFAPRATQPALMINGVDDHTFPLESSQKPLFELLGASTDQKQHILLGVGHTVEASLVIEQVDHWLARHFDDVNRTHSSWRDLAASHRNRADLALNAGQFEIAVNNYRHLLGLLVQHGGTDDDATISKIRFRLGLALEFQGGEKTKQATDIYRAASDERTRKLGPSHDSVHAARNRLGSLLSTTALALLGSSDMNEEIDLEQAKVDLREAESAVPKFAWPSLGLALAAYRQGSTEDAVNYLQQCESLQCSFGTEFYLRSIIAAEDGNYQEAQDWLTTIALEKTNRYRGQFKESVFLRAKAYQLVQRYSESIQSSKESGGALQRLSESYPNHYYLHWMQGRELIRKSKDMTAAHKRFRKAFEICPGYRSTDWYAITAQWLGDDDALAQCRDRLYGLSREKRGQNPGDQVQLARIYGRHPDADQYPANQISEFVDSVDTAIGYFGDKNASGTAKRLLQYRQGRETRIASFTRSGNPEEQAESMILSAITEYRFGDRRSAFERLDAARAFVRAKFPGPDGPTYKYVDSDHGWCVSNQLLQEAEALIELGSDDFDRQTAQAVGKLRSDLDERFGPSNSRAILLRVGNALVNHYSQQQPEIDTSETTED